MQIGLIGLGKMGGNMRRRIRAAGHTVIGYDRNPELSDSTSTADMIAQLTDSPRVVWVMVPEHVVDAVIADLKGLLSPGDSVIDGGNSKWRQDTIHAESLAENGIHFLDCGVSGGVWGLENGYALMVGGDAADVAVVQPVFDALKPAGNYGFFHAGGHGAGHFAKMVHNGIEYGIMQAYAEGYAILEATPLGIDVEAAIGSWQEGSVVRSWLLDLLIKALAETPDLDGIASVAADSGEGRWTVTEAVANGVSAPVISAALFARFTSQHREEDKAMKVISALRNQFGGHAIEMDSPKGEQHGGEGSG